MATPSTVTLVFGSQDLDVNSESLTELRQALLQDSNRQWLIDAISGLPERWKQLQPSSVAFQKFSADKFLGPTLEWLRRGNYAGSLPPPNIVTTVLTVTTHLLQFLEFVERHRPGIGLHERFTAPLNAALRTSGLCTGLLSAAAVASSNTLADLQRNGTTAIFLAMAIGAAVDATNDHEWSSVAASWASDDGEEKLNNTLQKFSKAYVAVRAESRQVTVTAPQEDISSLESDLRRNGFATTRTSLCGAFHFPENNGIVRDLIDFIGHNPDLQFSPVVHQMLAPNPAAEQEMSSPLYHVATKAMLSDMANWNALFAHIDESHSQLDSHVVSFGRKRCIPHSMARKLGSDHIHAGDSEKLLNSLTSDNDVAVIGMACHVPGGRDTHEFWDTLCTGLSQHIEVPEDRIRFNNPWRKDDPQRKWFGNFIDDHSAFDHKFFKKTPLEMASTDPQQRLIMQVAYQAVQQSGYFSHPSPPNTNVACYVGIGPNDYETGVAYHEPTAYTATGNLRSFAAGKISHYFGWSAPGVTIDTACSSSAVAIHAACKAILAGDCDAALAGGTNHLSGAEWYQNLAGASFLSTTGQCKPFDAAADGYCRSEGAGAVFLKRYSDAIKDGDQVFGVIKATFVAQNENCSAITAPTARSLSEGFRTVVAKSGLQTKQISLVEAHGTGTQVGDKAEYTAIRDVFANDGRLSPLTLASTKGHIGHLESASGVASVIKTLLMMQHKTIPPQASHSKFNPNLPGNPQEIQLASSLTPWSTDLKAALVNNYGASGSNASLVIAQSPLASSGVKPWDDTSKQPFGIFAHSQSSLQSYAAEVARFIRSVTDTSLADLSFSTWCQANRSLDQGIVFCANSKEDLLAKLDSYASATPQKSMEAMKRNPSRPVMLVFGGQVSASVSVSRDMYEQTKLFRKHLDECSQICSSLNLPSITPRVFDSTPVEDIVQLQLMLFSVQYSSAKCWIDSGVQVAAVVGHSFGELVAMCVSGSLSLRDAIWMVASRARIIKKRWGNDSGSMLFVEAEQEAVEWLLKESNNGASIACYNGPRSFTIAGESSEIDHVQEVLSSNQRFRGIRSKRLTVTNAFHSKLVDPLMEELKSVGEALVWREPRIYQERATREPNEADVPSCDVVATHMRDPVYFGPAVQRLAKKFPDAVWLEAGTGSGITGMASKALNGPESAFFQSISLSSIDNLAEATANLWKQGLNVSFWPHHRCQTQEYSPLLLPPYQFDKYTHWLDRKEPMVVQTTVSVVEKDAGPPSLWTFLGYQPSIKSQGTQEALFSINTASPEFQTHVSAHVIAQAAPICPTGFQYKIATDAIGSLVKKQDDTLRSELQGMINHAPIVRDETKQIRLIAQRRGDDSSIWDWRIESTPCQGGKSTLHVNGQVVFVESLGTLDQDPMFARYGRMVDHDRCRALLKCDDADHVLQGQRTIYKMFSPVVHYNEDEYKGLHKLVAKGSESAGRIVRTQASGALGVGLGDAFCQVAGIFANCMADCDETEMYLSNKLEHWTAPAEFPGDVGTVYEVYARHQRASDQEWLSDIFVFEPSSGRLLATIFGMGFIKLKITAMARLLNSLTGGASALPAQAPAAQLPSKVTASSTPPQAQSMTAPAESKPKKKVVNTVEGPLKGVLCNMLGVEEDEITPNSDLIDLGVDSLLAMELARDVQRACNVELDTGALMGLTDFQSLVDAVRIRLGEIDDSGPSEEDTCSDSDRVASDSGYETPFTPYTPYAPLSPVETRKDPMAEVQSQKQAIDLELSLVVETFEATKALTDDMIRSHKLAGFSHGVLPSQNELVVVHIMDAFEKLGCDLRSASPGQVLPRIPHLTRHQQIVDVFYNLLEGARVVDIADGRITRTDVPTSTKSAKLLLEELLQSSPEHGHDHKLTSLCGDKLAECLKGEAEGVQLLFGSAENRALVSASYADSPIHSTMVDQLAHFFKNLTERVSGNGDGPLKIMELGAGTGGTTGTLLPMLAATGMPIQYTVTDLSPGLVAGLRKRFNKEFPFTKFEVVNMEMDPPAHLLNEQHAILATNCVHATKDLSFTTTNIRKMLRPDGFLVMIEMTSVLPWVDLVFGLTEGWWLFNDGRSHACIKPTEWEKTLRASGFGYVDWTEGCLPESAIQQIIIARSGETHLRKSMVRCSNPDPKVRLADCAAREEAVSALVSQHIQGFTAPKLFDVETVVPNGHRTVLVTGATGSLGAHLVAHFAIQPNVDKVICLNRQGDSDPQSRQLSALASRGLDLDDATLSKLHILESDTAKPQLGLSTAEYIHLAMCVTDIVHNAWPMSLTRTLRGFTNQFKTMRNLINLARICRQSGGPRIGFELIGSVATIGYHPYATGEGLVPEEEMHVSSAMPIGYGEAKLVCEQMLQQTLRMYPDDFRAMTVRLGQIAGSRITGSWNETEHIAQLIKSSQTLNALPDLQGDLSWCPVNDIATTLGEILMHDGSSYSVYHIENPVRQPWTDMMKTLAAQLHIPAENIIPFEQWKDRIRGFPPSLADAANPAVRLMAFWEQDFIRMSCGLDEGGIVLDTTRTKEVSPIFRNLGTVSEEVVRKYIEAWRASGLLK